MGYKRPTITETYAELHLREGSLTETLFFKVVPKLQERGFSDVELTPAGFTFELKPGRMGPPREKQRVRCWKPGRRELAQVGEDLFIVNLTGDYPGWDPFLALFEEGLGALTAGLGEVHVKSLNLQTIDRFQVPNEGFRLAEYLKVGGDVIPPWYAASTESLDMVLGRGFLEHDGKNRRVEIKVRTTEQPVVIQFKAAFHDAVQQGVRLRDLLEQLHRESNATFESLITDRTRNEVMGGRA